MTGDYPPYWWPGPPTMPHLGNIWTTYTPGADAAALQERIAALEAEVERLRAGARRCPKRATRRDVR